MTETSPVSHSADIFESSILLLENNPGVPGGHFDVLSRQGYHVVRARDTREASAILRRDDNIALVVIDSGLDNTSIAQELHQAAADRSWIEYLVVGTNAPAPADLIYLSEEQTAWPVAARDRAEFLSSVSEAYNLSRMQRFQTTERQFLESALQEFRKRTDEAASQLLMRTRRRFRPADATSSPGIKPIPSLDSEEIGRLVKTEHARAHLRARVFATLALGSAGWMLILTLADAYSSGTELTVKSAAYGAGIPLSSALRKINELCEKGFLIRRQDPTDSRRSFVSLARQTQTLLVEYLSALKHVG